MLIAPRVPPLSVPPDHAHPVKLRRSRAAVRKLPPLQQEQDKEGAPATSSDAPVRNELVPRVPPSLELAEPLYSCRSPSPPPPKRRPPKSTSLRRRKYVNNAAVAETPGQINHVDSDKSISAPTASTEAEDDDTYADSVHSVSCTAPSDDEGFDIDEVHRDSWRIHSVSFVDSLIFRAAQEAIEGEDDEYEDAVLEEPRDDRPTIPLASPPLAQAPPQKHRKEMPPSPPEPTLPPEPRPPAVVASGKRGFVAHPVSSVKAPLAHANMPTLDDLLSSPSAPATESSKLPSRQPGRRLPRLSQENDTHETVRKAQPDPEEDRSEMMQAKKAAEDLRDAELKTAEDKRVEWLLRWKENEDARKHAEELERARLQAERIQDAGDERKPVRRHVAEAERGRPAQEDVERRAAEENSRRAAEVSAFVEKQVAESERGRLVRDSPKRIPQRVVADSSKKAPAGSVERRVGEENSRRAAEVKAFVEQKAAESAEAAKAAAKAAAKKSAEEAKKKRAAEKLAKEQKAAEEAKKAAQEAAEKRAAEEKKKKMAADKRAAQAKAAVEAKKATQEMESKRTAEKANTAVAEKAVAEDRITAEDADDGMLHLDIYGILHGEADAKETAAGLKAVEAKRLAEVQAAAEKKAAENKATRERNAARREADKGRHASAKVVAQKKVAEDKAHETSRNAAADEEEREKEEQRAEDDAIAEKMSAEVARQAVEEDEEKHALQELEAKAVDEKKAEDERMAAEIARKVADQQRIEEIRIAEEEARKVAEETAAAELARKTSEEEAETKRIAEEMAAVKAAAEKKAGEELAAAEDARRAAEEEAEAKRFAEERAAEKAAAEKKAAEENAAAEDARKAAEAADAAKKALEMINDFRDDEEEAIEDGSQEQDLNRQATFECESDATDESEIARRILKKEPTFESESDENFEDDFEEDSTTMSPRVAQQFQAKAQMLHDALDGFGTDEDLLIRTICQSSVAERQKIKDAYWEMFDEDLVDRVEEDTFKGSDFQKALLCMLNATEKPFDLESDCQAMYKAMKGWGTDETALVEMICNKTQRQMQLVNEKFKEMYDRELYDFVKSETSGHFQAVMLGWIRQPS